MQCTSGPRIKINSVHFAARALDHSLWPSVEEPRPLMALFIFLKYRRGSNSWRWKGTLAKWHQRVCCQPRKIKRWGTKRVGVDPRFKRKKKPSRDLKVSTMNVIIVWEGKEREMRKRERDSCLAYIYFWWNSACTIAAIHHLAVVCFAYCLNACMARCSELHWACQRRMYLLGL